MTQYVKEPANFFAKIRVRCAKPQQIVYIFLKNIEKTLILQTFPKSSMDKELEVRIEANRKEYERLLKDDDYTDVRFNPRNGALSAIHREHNFDPTIGIFGIPRGNYERISLDVLYDYGNCVILGSEKLGRNIRAIEGFLNGKPFDMKGIEGTGKRNIIDKISDASNKGAETIVLYFHEERFFERQRIVNAYNGYLKLSKTNRIQTVYYIVDNKLFKL